MMGISQGFTGEEQRWPRSHDVEPTPGSKSNESRHTFSLTPKSRGASGDVGTKSTGKVLNTKIGSGIEEQDVRRAVNRPRFLPSDSPFKASYQSLDSLRTCHLARSGLLLDSV